MNKKVTYGQLRRKLFSAAALLLVASIMMVSSSFAWYVLSTAPEVTNIKTQVGANGALEIALLDSTSWNDLSKLDMGDIDESKTTTAAEDNLTWGNLVDLGSASYGLDKIVLNPARLYLEESGVNGGGYSVGNTLLKTPVYGEDGRVKGLDKTSAVAYICQNGQFSETGHGVRAIGTCASMSVGQLGLNAARTNIISSATAARAAASNTLNSTGGKLANIVVAYAVNGQENGYTKDDVQSIKDLATGLQPSLEHIETALRYVFAGYICTEGSGVSAENYTTALKDIQSSETSLSALLDKYPGISTMIQNMGDYITELTADQKIVQDAIDDCNAKISGSQESFTWGEISTIVQPLANTDKMTVGGKNINQLKAELKNADGSINFGAAFDLLQGEGLTITVPTGSGLLSDIADFAGDYVAKVTVENVKVGNLGTLSPDVTMKTKGETPTYLTACSNGLAGATVGGDATSASITDYYGYALDLAFRTNAADSSLLLQTDPENRIYEGDGQNAALQGGGSYMTFKTNAGLSATKMVKLMSGIRVVFMDGDQNVLGIAVLDCTLGKDNYTKLTEEQQKTAPGKFAYLNNGTNTYQVSDLIDETTFNALSEKSSVVFERAAAVSGDETETAGALTGYITAKLYLHNFQMTKNNAGNATGALSVGVKDESGAITALEQDVVQKVTALVYLDGSVVTNASVAANAAQSMSGTLNLQFASSAELVPAENTKLRSGGSASEGGNTGNTETGGSETGDSETTGG